MRIISGEKRGAKLLAPKGSNTRPTRDRVKESLFNILLNHEFSNSFRHKVVIDAFAGSGALGLEALSRGAAHAIFIENDIAAIKTLKKNIGHLGYQQRSKIIETDASKTMISATEEAGLIIMDPPYYSNLALPCIEQLEKGGWIGKETILTLEHSSSREPVHLPWLDCIKTQKYGVSSIFFFKRK